MFEKEAEEYANEYGQDAFTQVNMPQWIEPIRSERKLGFQKGAEFGYNKANEWHKVSEQLPIEEKQYLLKFKDGTIDVFYVAIDGNLEPYILTRNFDFYKDVEKWREIPKE